MIPPITMLDLADLLEFPVGCGEGLERWLVDESLLQSLLRVG